MARPIRQPGGGRFVRSVCRYQDFSQYGSFGDEQAEDDLWNSIWKRVTAPNMMALYGIGMMIYGVGSVIVSLAKTIPAQSSPVEKGEVLRAYYVAEPFHSKVETGDIYVPAIRYRYAVAGQGYRSDRAWTGKRLTFRSLSEAKTFLAGFPQGSVIEVRYDPADPRRATLFVTHDYDMLVLAGVGLVLFGLSCLMRSPGPRKDTLNEAA